MSPEDVELQKKAIVYHTWSDVDPLFIVVVNPKNGQIYRIHGFGLAESSAEFERLMASLNVRVASPDQAESLAEFYRKVNPANYESLTPIVSLLELKQAAERQCQGGQKSFDAGEKAFTAWWTRAKPLFSEVSFKTTATPSSGGYSVDWVVLSSDAKGNCGGAPLRARLEIGLDVHVRSITVVPVQKG